MSDNLMAARPHFLEPTLRDEGVGFQGTILQKMRDPSLQSFCDVTLIAEGKRFSLHRAVLSGASEMLRGMLASSWTESGLKEISLKHVPAVALKYVVEYIYMGTIDVSSEDKCHLLEIDEAARYLLMPAAMLANLRSMILRSITITNVFAVGCHAHKMADDELESECERFACERFQEILESPTFLELPFPCLEHFLASNDLILKDGEVQLLQRISTWVSHDLRSRAGHFHKLLDHVRFADMALEELAAIVESAGPDSEISSRAALAITGLEMNKLSVADSDNHGEAEALNEHVGNTIPQPAPTLQRRQSRGGERSNREGGEVGMPRFRAQRRCVRNIRFDFVIRNIANPGQPMQALNSPWYKCGGGLLWRLELYPRGSAATLGDYMSVFLRCCNSSGEEDFECSASFSLFLIEQNFGGQEKVFEATKIFTADEPCWGRSRYIARSELLAENGRAYSDSRGNVVVGVSVVY